MANNLIMNVSENFNLDSFVKQLVANFQAEGYSVNCSELSGMKKILIGKDNSGIKNFLGLGQGITVTCGVNNNMLNLTYSDGNWGFKVFQFIMGSIFLLYFNGNWGFKFYQLLTGRFTLLYFIGLPFLICAIIGTVKQATLPNKISEAGKMIAQQIEESNRYFVQNP